MMDEELIGTDEKVKLSAGRGGKHNFPAARAKAEISEDRALVSRMLNELIAERRRPKVKTDEELAERIDDFISSSPAAFSNTLSNVYSSHVLLI